MQRLRPSEQTDGGLDRALVDQGTVQAETTSSAKSTLHNTVSPKGQTTPPRLRLIQIIVQPVIAWMTLLLTAEATGQFSRNYAYPLQTAVLLHGIPLLILALVGIRLKRVSLALVAGLLFATAFIIFSMMHPIGPISTTLFFAMMMPLTAALAATATRIRWPYTRLPLAVMGTGLGIACSVAGLTLGFVQTQRAQVVPVTVQREPFNGLAPAVIDTAERTLLVNDLPYIASLRMDPVTLEQPTVPNVFETGNNLTSLDGSTTVVLSGTNVLSWRQGEKMLDIVTGPISDLSMNSDGNMLVFRQNDKVMVFTPSMGARGLADILKKFDGRVDDDALIRTAQWSPDGLQLTGNLGGPYLGNQFVLDLAKE